MSKIRSNFAAQKSQQVAWMSGLVTGLQNRVQRFESASDLHKKSLAEAIQSAVFFIMP